MSLQSRDRITSKRKGSPLAGISKGGTERRIMLRLIKLALALFVFSITAIGLEAAPAHASTGTGPTAGTVEVEFNSLPLALVKHVGNSGKFDIKLSPGSYTVFGCGPKKSANQCSQPQDVTLATGQVDHIQLVWELLP
jgi:hypothetical protein